MIHSITPKKEKKKEKKKSGTTGKLLGKLTNDVVMIRAYVLFSSGYSDYSESLVDL